MDKDEETSSSHSMVRDARSYELGSSKKAGQLGVAKTLRGNPDFR